tara:strand:+ start:802 stop:1104 length:303 start_codon:yes stop_codon:yes gene_type:complete
VLVAPTPVKAEPSIAGKAPVKLAEVKLVRLEPLIAGKSPVRLAEVRLVRPEPSPVKFGDVIPVVPFSSIDMLFSFRLRGPRYRVGETILLWYIKKVRAVL